MRTIECNHDGVEDVAISDSFAHATPGGRDDVSLFRMERMSDQEFWIAFYVGGNRTTFNAYIEDGKLKVQLLENTLNASVDCQHCGADCEERNWQCPKCLQLGCNGECDESNGHQSKV